jgi:dCMP deaminase
MIIGLTGKNASGKGEVAKFLTSRNFVYFSLSDAIREELKRQGKAVTRENLIQMGNELRRQFGPGVLADRILAQMETDKNYTVDSIRNPQEVERLRKRKDFVLVDVAASQEIRFKRIRERNRENDPRTFEDFLRFEAKEESENPEEQQLGKTGALRDIVLENNGSLEELQEKTLELVQKIARSLYRPDWDEYFMAIAKTVAMRSSCIKRKVAAVIVKENRIISTGYNGTPRGIPNCNSGGCPRCNSMTPSGHGLDECICSHAEENSITQAAYHGVSIKGGTIYITYSPCLTCAKMIINSGIQEVVYNEHYSIAEAPLGLLQKAGIRVRAIEIGGVSDKQIKKGKSSA